MKKRLVAFIVILMLGFMSYAQDTSKAPSTAQTASFSSASSEHYVVWSDGGNSDAANLATLMDGLFVIYNEYFRFDESNLKGHLTVRKFSDKNGFDTYMRKIIGETKDDFVYLHYPSIERSELVI